MGLSARKYRNLSWEEVLAWAKRTLFAIQTADIYPTKIAGFFDLGPRGEATVRKFVALWRKLLVEKENAVLIDGAQILPKEVFIASGHLETFTDPLTKCEKCGALYRADKLLEDLAGIKAHEKWAPEDFTRVIEEKDIRCPLCGGKLSKVVPFNLMMKTYITPRQIEAYLKPESCQNIYLNFKWIYERIKKLPLPIAQVGKAFRNEISPRKFFVRAREFRQADIEVYFDPEKDLDEEKWKEVKDYVLRIQLPDSKEIVEVTCEEAVKRGLVSKKIVAYWLARAMQFFECLGIKKEDMKLRALSEDERPFYSTEAWDFEIWTGDEWIEVVGCHNRTDYDLSGHSKVSGTDLRVKREDGTEFFPHIMEISMGVERPVTVLVKKFLVEEELENGKKRVVLKIPPIIAPITAVVMPLLSNREELVKKAREVYEFLKNEFEDHVFITIAYEEKGSIGSRYRKHDEIGTPLAITIDYQTLQDDTVTVRDRDTMQQVRVKIEELPKYIKEVIYKDIKKRNQEK